MSKENTNFSAKGEKEESKISFRAAKPGELDVTMEIKKGKFIWNGKEIKDVNKIYERFSEWMTLAENANNIKKED